MVFKTNLPFYADSMPIYFKFDTCISDRDLKTSCIKFCTGKICRSQNETKKQLSSYLPGTRRVLGELCELKLAPNLPNKPSQ